MDRIVAQKKYSNYGGAGVQSWTLDIGYLYKALCVRFANAVANLNDLTLVELLINGAIVWSLSGAQLDALNQYYGMAAFAGTDLVLPFGMVGMTDPRLLELTYINTGQPSPTTGKIISSFELRLTFAAAHTVDVYAAVSDSTSDGPGMIRWFYPGSGAASAASFTEINNLPVGTSQAAYWRTLFTTPSAGTISWQTVGSGRLQVWGPMAPPDVGGSIAAMARKVPGAFFGSIVDFSMLNSGYVALASTDVKGAIVPGTADFPLLDTTPYKQQALVVQTYNSAAGVNSFLLEALGEIA